MFVPLTAIAGIDQTGKFLFFGHRTEEQEEKYQEKHGGQLDPYYQKHEKAREKLEAKEQEQGRLAAETMGEEEGEAGPPPAGHRAWPHNPTSHFILAHPRFLLSPHGRAWAQRHPKKVDWFIRHHQPWMRQHPYAARVLRRHHRLTMGPGGRWHGIAGTEGVGMIGTFDDPGFNRAGFEVQPLYRGREYGATYAHDAPFGILAGVEDEDEAAAVMNDYGEVAASVAPLGVLASGYDRGRMCDGLGMPGYAPSMATVGYLDDLGFYGRARTYGRGSNFQYPGC